MQKSREGHPAGNPAPPPVSPAPSPPVRGRGRRGRDPPGTVSSRVSRSVDPSGSKNQTSRGSGVPDMMKLGVFGSGNTKSIPSIPSGSSATARRPCCRSAGSSATHTSRVSSPTASTVVGRSGVTVLVEGVGAVVSATAVVVVEATTVVVSRGHGGGRCRDTVGRGRGACRHQEKGRYPDDRPFSISAAISSDT